MKKIIKKKIISLGYNTILNYLNIYVYIMVADK